MIDKKAVKDFLSRDLGNHDWLKTIPVEKLDAELKMLKPKPNFDGIKLWERQKAGLLLALELKRFLYFWDMGGGKTLLSLTLLKYLKQCGQKPKAIVFVPYITSVDTWVEEVAKNAPDLNCVPLLGSTSQNELTMQQADGDLFVICYQSAVAMVSYPVTKKGKRGWGINSTEVTGLFFDFNILICDEIHRCFPAGIKIKTILGQVAIENIRVGDMVDTGTGFRAVVAVMNNQAYTVSVSLETGQVIKCTPSHPFLTDRDWETV